MVYNIGFISVIHHHELTIGLHMSLPSRISLPTSTHSQLSKLLQSPSFSSLSHITNSNWLAITDIIVYASMLLCPFISLSRSSPLPLSISLFSMSVSPLLLCKQIGQYYLSRFHTYVLIHDINLLYSV